MSRQGADNDWESLIISRNQWIKLRRRSFSVWGVLGFLPPIYQSIHNEDIPDSW